MNFTRRVGQESQNWDAMLRRATQEMETDVETVRNAYRVLDGKVNKIKDKWGDVNLRDEVQAQVKRHVTYYGK